MRYCEFKIEDFLEKLSSTESMPGGGTVAAIVGANAVSCALKVCNLSLGKEKYKENEKLIKDSIKILEEKRKLFLDFMDKDAESFKAMEDVYKLPKVTEEEKAKRKDALANACKICSDIPIKIINVAVESIDVVSKLVGKTNASAASDLKIADMMLRATVKGGWENVKINAKYITDEKYLKFIDGMRDVVSHVV